MKRSLAFFYVGGLFLLGILLGALAMHLYWAARFPGPVAGGPPGPHGRMFLHGLEQRLQLTPEQRSRIDAIVEESRAEGEALRREMHPRVRAQMERTRERIREVLTPEQREEFARMLEHEDRRAERFFLGREGRPGPRRRGGGPPPR